MLKSIKKDERKQTMDRLKTFSMKTYWRDNFKIYKYLIIELVLVWKIIISNHYLIYIKPLIK